MSNKLTPIEGGKSNEPTSIEKSKGKKSPVELYLNIHAAFVGEPNIFPKFPLDFRFIESDDGVRMPIEVDEQKVCHYVSEGYVVDKILCYAHDELNHMNTRLSHSQAGECYKMIRGRAPKFDANDIMPVGQKSEDCLCWHRLPFDLEEGPTPTFDEMFSRMDAGESVMAWIGSLLDPKADKQQYLWIYGDGQNGKSSLASFLRRVLGPAYRAEQVPDHTTRRFWTAGILGKRLVCFPDCSEPRFTTTGFFKGLTGGDAQRIEKKGKEPFDAELDAKFLFLSNQSPLVTGGRSDLRRALYVEMSEFKGKVEGQEGYGSRLWSEGAQMLDKCVRTYRKVAGSGNPVPLSAGSLQKLEILAEESEDSYQEIMATHGLSASLERNRAAELNPDIKLLERPFMYPVDLQRYLKASGIVKPMEQKMFLRWIERKYGAVRKRVKVSGVCEWRIVGISGSQEGSVRC